MTTPDAPSPTPPRPETPDVPPPAAGRPGRWFVPLAVAAGLAAGALSWAAGETGALTVQPVRQQVNFFGSGVMVPSTTPEARLAAMRQSAALGFGLLGGLMGLALGAVGGASAGSIRRALRTAAIGAAAGGLLGALVPWLTVPEFERRRIAGGASLLPSLLMHATFWVPIGAAGGLALALGRLQRAAPIAGGGALGATAATLAYEVLGAVAFPLARTGEPISVSPTARLLACLLVAGLTAAGAALRLAARGVPPTLPPKGPIES